MIDTIVLRLHDLHAHQKVVRHLYLVHSDGSREYRKIPLERNSVDFDRETQKIISEKLFHRSVLNTETGEIQYSNINVNPYLTRIEYKDSGKGYSTGFRGHIQLPSCHYSIAFYVNRDRDFIEFNFSVPKYLYGTNVLQFLPHHFSKKFDATRSKSFANNISVVYNRLLVLIKDFFNCEFPTCRVNYKKVEINRIDICFNQIFDTDEDCKQYLNSVRLIKKKYARDNNFKDVSPWGNNVFYKSSLYSFKIYYKGDEFVKNDLKELQSLSRKRGFLPMDLELVSDLASRTLRYELTIHNQYLSYIFYQTVFRKTCPLFKNDRGRFARVRSLLEKRDKVLEIYSNLSDPLYQSSNSEAYYIALTAKEKQSPYTYIDKRLGITRKDERFYSFFTRLTSNRLKFMLESEDDDYFHYTQEPDTDKPPVQSVKFSMALFKDCAMRFWEMVNGFSVTDGIGFDTFNKNILEHNKAVEKMRQSLKGTGLRASGKSYNVSRLASFMLALERFGSFDKACDALKIPRTTKYRLKKDLSELGVSDRSVLPYPISVQLDYSAYHRFVMENHGALFFFKKTYAV